jgi:hypothetical protein
MEPAEVLATEQATTIAVRLPRSLDGVNEARVVSRNHGASFYGAVLKKFSFY